MGIIRWNAQDKQIEEENADGDWECVVAARLKGKKFSFDAAIVECCPKFRREMIKRWNAVEKAKGGEA